jgi:hypothetical protein
MPLTGGTYGYTTFNQTRVPTLTLGDIRLADRPVLYPDKKDFPADLGMDILGGYKVLLDFPAHKMYLMPQTPLALVQVKPAAPTAPAPAVPPATTTPEPAPPPKQP